MSCQFFPIFLVRPYEIIKIKMAEFEEEFVYSFLS